MSTVGSRLREERERLGLSQVAFSERGHVGKHSQINYESDRRNPDSKYLSSIGKIGADIMYILTGTGNPTLPDRTLPLSGDVRIGEQVYSTIKVYDIDASAGLGTVPVSEAVADQIAFTRAWLIRHGIPADMSGLVRVRGDSMEPTIPDGSYVLVQFNIDQSNLKPGIYIIRLDDAIVIKRLQLSPKKEDNWISLISDNPSYPPTVINNPDDTSFVAIARVRTVISEV